MAVRDSSISPVGWFTAHRRALPERVNPFAIRILMLFLVLEYIRPLLLAELKLQMLIVLAMLGLWYSARNRPWSGILTAQVVFLVVCVAAIPFASNYYAAYFTARTILGHLAIALGLSWLMSNPATFRSVVWAWILIMGYVAVYGILHGGTGPGAMLGDENDLALGCATAFPFAFYGFERLSGWRRWVCAGTGGLMVAAIVTSFSRGGFVALVAVGVYCWLASRHKVRGLVVVALATILLVVVAPTLGRTGESYTDRLYSMFNTEEGTVEGRQFLWATARNMWKAHPLLGVGAGNFPYVAGRYQPREGYDKPEYLERDWTGTVTHSLYFQMLSENGTVGVLILAYLVFAHFRTLRWVRRHTTPASGMSPALRHEVEMYAGALGGAVVGYCVAGAFLSVAYYPYLWYFTAMAVALEHLVTRDRAVEGVS